MPGRSHCGWRSSSVPRCESCPATCGATITAALVQAAVSLGELDLVVNNASELGPSPLPALRELDPEVLVDLHRINVVAPLALIQLALPLLERRSGAVVNVTSDAAVEAYEGWGAYGSSKAALEQLSHVLAAEHPALRGLVARPRRHADRDASGGVPRRGHLGPAPARIGRPRGARPRDKPTTKRPATRWGPVSDGGVVITDRLSFELPPSLEAPEPPEGRGLTRTRCACWWPTVRARISCTAPSCSSHRFSSPETWWW